MTDTNYSAASKDFYDCVERDSLNFGRVFVHFRWK